MEGTSSTTSILTDRDLVGSMREAGSTAFEALFKRHASTVHAYISSKLVDAGDVDDTFQEVFVLAWSKLDKELMTGRSAAPWLLSTAHNVVSSTNRKRQRADLSPLLDIPTISAAEAHDIEAGKAALELTLRAALQSLSPEDRRVVHLCLEKGLSYKEAARVSRASTSMVRNRLFRARKALRRALLLTMAEEQ